MARRAIPIVVMSLMSAFIATQPAHATTSKSYMVSQSTYSSTLGRCIRVTLAGTITYDTYWVTSGNAQYYANRKVTAPRMIVETYVNCYTTTAASVTSLDMSQTWYDQYSHCSGNLGLSAGYPWGISVQPTVNCGTTTVATQTTAVHYGVSSTYYQDDNPYTSISFKANDNVYYDKYLNKYYPLCLEAHAEAIAYRSNLSVHAPLEAKVCV
jgi:hypothetical protein